MVSWGPAVSASLVGALDFRGRLQGGTAPLLAEPESMPLFSHSASLFPRFPATPLYPTSSEEPSRFAGTIMRQCETIFLLCYIVDALTISRLVVTSTASSPSGSAHTEYALSKQRWRKFIEMMTLLARSVVELRACDT
jgi:hypothetical protein